MPCRLEVKDLSCSVRLGYTEQERALPQEVLVSLDILFLQNPQAAESDKLNDTFCYGKLCERIQQVCAEKPYALLEHLSYLIHHSIKSQLKNCTLKTRVHKVRVPVDNLRGGCVVEWNDQLELS